MQRPRDPETQRPRDPETQRPRDPETQRPQKPQKPQRPQRPQRPKDPRDTREPKEPVTLIPWVSNQYLRLWSLTSLVRFTPHISPLFDYEISNHLPNYVPINSKHQHPPPRQTPGIWTFEDWVVQIPTPLGQNWMLMFRIDRRITRTRSQNNLWIETFAGCFSAIIKINCK